MCKVIGVGTDLCQISRIERAIEKEHFFQRIFTEKEHAYLHTKGKQKAQSAAAMFAAKEAVAKALGTGFSMGVSAGDITVTHDENSAPGIVLDGGAKTRFDQMGGTQVLLSLSHEGDMAIAFVVIQG